MDNGSPKKERLTNLLSWQPDNVAHLEALLGK